MGLTPSSPPCAVPGLADDGDRVGRIARRPLPPSVWEEWEDERLLDLRLCDLDLVIAGSELEARINELERELQERGLGFRPHYWLSDEWFCPDGVPGFDKGGWTGMFVQAKVPEPVVNQVYQAVAKVLKDPEATKKLADDGLVAVASTPKEFTTFIHAEIKEWNKLIKEMKL